MPNEDQVVSVVAVEHGLGNRPLFRALDLEARTGQVHAVLGPSGAGKSTLLRMIGGLERPRSGTIRSLGYDVPALRGVRLRRYLRHTVGFVFQDAGLVEQWSVRQNLQAAARAAPSAPTSTPFGVDEVMNLMDLPTEYLGRRAVELSGGERQRVAIAKILVRKPRLVLMDEPTAALDADRTSLVMRIVRDLADDGAAVLVASHDPEVLRVADGTTDLGSAQR